MAALWKPVILLPLRPTSLMRKNSQRHQIIHGIHPVQCKEGSIDSVRVISVAVVLRCIFLLVFFMLYIYRRTIINFSKL